MGHKRADDYVLGAIVSEQAQQVPETPEQTLARQQWLQEQGVQQMNSSITISTREQLAIDQHNNLTPDYVNYGTLQWYAEQSVRSHRLEQLAAHSLRELGLDARVQPVTIDGRTLENKRADIIINYKGHEYAVEVKENRRETLGLPLSDDDRLGLHGYSRYPKSLWVDSVAAYDAKVKYHWSQGQLLVGVIVLCSIGELSDEDYTCYGTLWLHGERKQWKKQTCHNPSKGTTYTAYKTAYAEQVQPLVSVLESLDAASELMQQRKS